MVEARRTLVRYYVYAALSGLQFTWTTWLAFVLARGGNPGWAEAAFHLAILLGEVPTGAVADRLGRRTSMMMGLALNVLTTLAFLLISNTPTALVVMALSGFSLTFQSGADTALLYEAAEVAGGPELARKAMARANALQLGALAVAPVVAGLLYEWWEGGPFVARSLVALISLLVVWRMREIRSPGSVRAEADPTTQAGANPAAHHGAGPAPHHGVDPTVDAGADPAAHPGVDPTVDVGANPAAPDRAAATVPAETGLWAQVRAGLAVVQSSPAARTLVIFGWGYYALTAMPGQFAQAYFPAAGLTMAATGLVFSVARLASTAGSLVSERLPERAGNSLLRLVPLGLALAYLAMGLPGAGWYGVGAYLVADLLDGTLEPLFNYRLSRAVPAAHRATVLSLHSAGFSLIMTVAFPAAAYLQPVSRIYLVLGLVGLALAMLWLRLAGHQHGHPHPRTAAAAQGEPGSPGSAGSG